MLARQAAIERYRARLRLCRDGAACEYLLACILLFVQQKALAATTYPVVRQQRATRWESCSFARPRASGQAGLVVPRSETSAFIPQPSNRTSSTRAPTTTGASSWRWRCSGMAAANTGMAEAGSRAVSVYTGYRANSRHRTHSKSASPPRTPKDTRVASKQPCKSLKDTLDKFNLRTDARTIRKSPA